MSELKLLALDNEDLQVISTYAQDAVIRIVDMVFSDGHFILMMNRYAWEKDKFNKRKKDKGQRARSILRFDYVQNVKAKGFDLNAKEGVLELLSISFEEKEKPQGNAILSFAGGATINLSLECLEVKLHDLGAAWKAKNRPEHDIS